MEENLEREKKVRADVEKTKRKMEADLKMTQETVEELESTKRDLEDKGRKSVNRRFSVRTRLRFVYVGSLFSRDF